MPLSRSLRRFARAVVMAAMVLIPNRPAMAAQDARPLMTEVWRRMRGLETERETLEVFVISEPDKAQYRPGDLDALKADGRRGVVRKRATRSIGYAPDGHDKLHIVFSEPAEDSGTALLVWRQPSSPQDDQWLYLPALKRVRRLPASSTQTFAGSNFSYEDVRSLTSEPLERFDYEVTGEETIDGQQCTLVRATPREGTISAYSSRTIAIATGSLFPVRTVFQDSKGSDCKILYDVDAREVAPQVWRPSLTELRDLKLGESTVIAFDAREVNVALSPSLFTEDSLERSLGK